MRRILLASLCLAALTSYAAETTLGPGMPAPKLQVGKWLKGAPVASVGKGIVVVEFWATWCGPCRESIPHLTEMAKKNPSVTFIGVSAFEHGKPDDEVGKFVASMGEKMDYHVVVDSKDFMANNWMQAAKQPGIPTAFLLKDGVIQWIGHPMEMEKPLGEVVAGKFDVSAFKVQYAKAQEEQEAQQKVGKSIQGVQKLLAAGKGTEALAAIDKIAKDTPSAAGMLTNYRSVANALIDPAKGKADVDSQLAQGKFDEVAGMIPAFPKGNETALYAANQILAGDGAKSVIADYEITMYGIQSANKDLALRAVTAGEKALPGSKYNNDQIKGLFAELRKQAEAIK